MTGYKVGMSKTVIATIFSNAIHNEQVLSAAKLWAEKNGYKFVLRCEKHPDPYYVTVVCIAYNGLSMLFDMSDSPHLVRVETVIHVYFKRSYVETAAYHGHSYRVRPYGFNYGMAYRAFNWKRMFSFGFDKVYAARTLPVVNRFTNLSYRYIDYRRLHATPRDNGGNILFLTRLWDPANVRSEEKKAFRQQLNNTRIDTVKLLRKKQFSGRLLAGMEDTPLAREICPELIVPRSTTGKKNYLHQLSKADICIATSGLENTIGWRIAEYVAFSKAIVSEPFNVAVPEFYEGEHYSPFTTDIIDKVDALLYNRKYLQMQEHNYAYYQKYMEPVTMFNRFIQTEDT